MLNININFVSNSQVMKRICIIVVCSMLATSCSKSALMPQNVRYHNVFIGMKGHDLLARGASMFCVAGDTVKLRDTIDIITYTPNNPNKYGYEVGTLYVVEDPFNAFRDYWKLNVFVKSWVEYL